jgi:hypothetical protein
MIQNTYIIGYSLSSVLYARELAEANNKITFVKTGKLGYPLDDLNDCLYESTVNRIKSFSPKILFNKFTNYTYAFFPYSQLDFVNSHNGLLSYPLNKKTFECAEEWEQIQYCISNLEKFKNKLEHSNNYVNIYKKFFPKWLYDSVIKHIGINKWHNQKQSKFTKDCLSKEINLDLLGSGGSGNIYRPINTYESISEELLKHPNIKVISRKIQDLNKFIIERHKNSDVIFMDNRIDYLTGFAQGKFERIYFKTELSQDTNTEEFFDINTGIVFTPMKDYWCITNNLGEINKIVSYESDDYNLLSQIVPTVPNSKLYKDYKSLLNLYSGKFLNLDNYVDSVIF